LESYWPSRRTLELLLDVDGLVGEVEDEYVLLRLQWVDPVDPRQRLHGGDPGQQLVDVHRGEQWLVEARLVLLGDGQDAFVGLALSGSD
jgi:hypothetical protein